MAYALASILAETLGIALAGVVIVIWLGQWVRI